MKRFFCLLAAFLLLCTAALADDVLLVDLDECGDAVFTTDCAGLQILKTVSDSSEHAQEVRLIITIADSGQLLLDKYYGYVGGFFDSGVLYPDYEGEADYLITLYVGGDKTIIRLHYPLGSGENAEAQAEDATCYSGWVD